MTLKTRLPLWALALTACAALLAGYLIGLAMQPAATTPAVAATSTTAPASDLLSAASTTCNLPPGSVTDGGNTLAIDGAGDDDRKVRDGKITVSDSKSTLDQIECALGELDAPGAVTTKIHQTRAMDGRQEDSWASFNASWTYHPDAGLDIIITAKPS